MFFTIICHSNVNFFMWTIFLVSFVYSFNQLQHEITNWLSFFHFVFTAFEPSHLFLVQEICYASAFLISFTFPRSHSREFLLRRCVFCPRKRKGGTWIWAAWASCRRVTSRPQRPPNLHVFSGYHSTCFSWHLNKIENAFVSGQNKNT